MLETKTVHDQFIEALIQGQVNFDRSVERLRFAQRHYAAALEWVREEFSGREDLSFTISTYVGSWADVSLRIAADRLDAIVPILRYFVQEWDLRIVDFPSKQNASSSPERRWRLFPRALVDRRWEIMGQIALEVVISARHCKRVQVGTQEVPVFETQCEWSEEGADQLPTEEKA